MEDIFERTFLNDYVTYDVEILDIGEKEGFTGYIDFIGIDQFNTSLVKGLDKYLRPFICMKVRVTFDDKSYMNLCQTFFQRYSNEKNLWTSASLLINSTDKNGDLIVTYGGMSKYEKNFIREIVKNKCVDMKNYDHTQIRFRRKIIELYKNNVNIDKIELINFMKEDNIGELIEKDTDEFIEKFRKFPKLKIFFDAI